MSAEFTELESILRHAAWVRRAALGLTRDAHRAEDLVQETWTIALSRPPSSTGNVRGWLGTVLRNAARSVARSDSRRRARERDSARGEALPPAESLVEEAELAARLAREVDALDESSRTAIVLVYFEGRTAASIARELDLPEATVRSRVHRGLHRLRERLAQERDGGRGAWIALLGDLAARRARTGPLQSPATPVAAVLSAMSSKTLLIVTAVASVVLIAYLAQKRNPDPTRPTRIVAASEGLASAGPAGRASATLFGERVPVGPSDSGTELPAGAPEATGSVLVRLRWASDDAPASGVMVGMVYRTDPSYLQWHEARSGDDGSALLEGLHVGPVRVRTDRGAGTDVDVRAGECEQTELSIPRGIDVSGLVIDEAGNAVGGASITLSSGLASHGSIVAVADAQGRFDVRDVMDGQTVGARMSGREPSRIERIQGIPGSTVDLVLVLESEGAAVEGIVLDASGKPISAALVCVGDEHAWSGGGRKPSPAGLRVRTGEAGRFLVEGVPVGTLPIVARTPGFAPARVTVNPRPGATEHVEFHLGRGGTLEGVVRGEDGVPVIGASVSVGVEPYANIGDLGFLRTETGNGGHYVLACVPAGEVEVRVEAELHGKTSEQGTLAEGEHRRLDFQLSRGNVITGRLVDPQGNALARWWVQGNCTARRFRSDEDFKTALNWHGNSRSGEDGGFLLLNCPALEVTLGAFPPDGIGGQPAAMLTIERPPANDLRFVVPASIAPDAWIRGRLRMHDGGPIPSIEVFVFDSEHQNQRGTLAEIDSKSAEFRVGPLGPGSWTLAVRSELVCPLDHPPIKLMRHQDRDLGTIELVAPGFVRARIVHREKGNWKRVQIGLCDRDFDRRDGQNDRVQYFDLSGTTWKSPPLTPGTQAVVLKVGDGADETRKLAIRSGEETPLEIEID